MKMVIITSDFEMCDLIVIQVPNDQNTLIVQSFHLILRRARRYTSMVTVHVKHKEARGHRPPC